jgi:xanthine dehydrogenase molybdenum-binding subunit
VDVRIKGTIIGGGFGGKEDIMAQIHVAMLAERTQRPVKILYDRRESMLADPKRHATVMRIKTGAKRDGTLTAVQAEIEGDAGAYASLSDKVMTRATTHATGPYEVPNAKIDCYVMYTNNPPAGAFRGFGVTQSAFGVEQNMDILAQRLGMDPIALRRMNALRVGAVTATGQVLTHSVGLLECLDWVESTMMSLEDAPLPETGLEKPIVGWGIAAAYKNTGLGGGTRDGAGAFLKANEDGTVEVRSSSADLGQGLPTVLTQFAAEILGLDLSAIRVRLSDTDLAPDGGPTTASRQTYITGNAVCMAAERMRERLAAVAGRRWKVDEASVLFEDGWVRSGSRAIAFSEAVRWLAEAGGDLTVRCRYEAPPTRSLGKGGDMHFAFGFGVQAAQVAVSRETGEVKVLRIVATADGGRPINPQAFRGQVEGGVVMGIGTALTEVYRLEDGIPKTVRWADYKIPLIRHMPEIHVELVERPIPSGPYGAKGVGELPSIPTAPAICNAIADALSVRVRELPVRPLRLRRER